VGTRTAALAAICAWFALASAASCQETRFSAHTVDGILAPAALLRLGPDWSVELAAPAGAVAAGDLVELRQASTSRPAWLRQHFVQLSHGDSIPLAPEAPVRLADGRLSVTPVKSRAPQGTELSIYGPYVSFFFRELPDNVDEPDLFLSRLRREPRPRDVVFLRNGDRLEGTVTSLDSTSECTVDDDGRSRRVAAEHLAGVAWNTVRQARPRPRTPVGHAVLADGSRLNFSQLRLERGGEWTGTTWFGAPFRGTAEDLVALDIWNGPAVYLCDRSGAYRHTPYLGLSWPLALGAAVGGGPLALGQCVYDKGLGMHSASRVSYELGGGYRWFEAVAGIDAGAGARGRARLRVLVDGRRNDVAAKEELHLDDGPVLVRIDVRGAQTLTIVTDFGSLGDVRGHVNWCNARLVR
jgi:hypothetical protein